MKRLVLTAFAVAALLLPAAAAAKGPSEAKISGPGLGSTVTIAGNGEGDTSTDLGLLVTEAGFFPEVYGQSPSTLEQDLYPYAADGPASHMRPGQRFWGTQSTVGGWYRGTSALKTMLIRAGLPRTPVARPRTGSSRGIA